MNLRMVRRLALCLLASFALLGGVARAAEPPDQNDPCSRGGKDSCATTGQGSYRSYRYGVRWFGDYRGAVPGVDGGTFCIDLRYWYPSKDAGYEKRSTANLRNRGGDAISAAKLRLMSYAVWQYGRSNDPSNQAAVMLYVHSLMGDGAPGEVDPSAISASSRATFARIEKDAKRNAGPYTVKATVPAKLVAGTPSQLTVEVRSASGARVPDAEITFAGAGANALPAKVSTGDSGQAKVAFTPTTALNLDVNAPALAADAPALYVPTKGKAARNGQRLVAPAFATRTAKLSAKVLAQPALATQVSDQSTLPGGTLTDTVKVSGLAGRSATVQAALYGPYPSRAAITCADTPVWTGSFSAAADGDYTTDRFTVTTPGYYVYRESIAETADVAAVQTQCADTAETTVVRGSPAVTTQVSAQATAPGATITDTAVVSGLGKLGATVNVELWGPYPSRAAIACTGTPAWTGTLAAAGDGSYATPAFTVPAAGYYTYRESIAATEAYPAVTTACGDAAETTLATATPQVTTAASSDVVKPGGELFDRVKVTGLGKTPAQVEVELFGPYATRAEMDCAGTPYWKGTLDVTGDGEFSSPKATVKRAGFYVFRERIAGSESIAATQTDCALEAETSLGAPMILTGRGDEGVAEVRAAQAGDARPTRVQLTRAGVDAKVYAIGIDTKAGALGIPSDIHRVGWWRDGAAPGSAAGAILLAGHIDSAKDGAGAFYGLKGARRGDRVELTSADGKTRRYRVATVSLVRKAALPSGVFSRTGRPRLVLVTCSGPFDAKSGHYRDNLIVTATPD